MQAQFRLTVKVTLTAGMKLTNRVLVADTKKIAFKRGDKLHILSKSDSAAILNKATPV